MRASTLSSAPRPVVVALSRSATRIQRLARPIQKHHRIAIVKTAAAAPLQLACPLDDDDDDCGDEFLARSSSSSTSTSSSSPSTNLPLLGRRVLITAPRSYAASLGGRILAAGGRPLSVPGVRTLRLRRGRGEERELDAALRELLSSSSKASKPFAAVAFTSRAGIEAVLERIAAIVAAGASSSDLSSYSCREEALAAGGAALAAAAAAASSSSFSLWALGADAEALASAGVPAALIRTPQEASTTGMVSEMAREGGGDRSGSYADSRILCPVPAVVGGLAEPPVVPRFLRGLRERVGAVPVRVAAYSTAPPADARRSERAGVAPSAAAELSLLSAGEIDAVVFSSTAEAQGLAMAAGGVEALLGMIARGNEARREKRRRRSKGGGSGNEEGPGDPSDDDSDDDIVLAAHGPYTAAGASEVFGGEARISVVPETFSSFAGVVSALEEEFRRRRRRRR